MEALLVRKVDPGIKIKLRIQAARNGRSMEEEAREILRIALSGPDQPRPNLADSIRRRVADFGGVDLTLPQREPIRPAPKFD